MLTPAQLSGSSEAHKPSHLDKVSNLTRTSLFITYCTFHLLYSEIIFTSPAPLTQLPVIPFDKISSSSLFCRHAWFQWPCFHCIKFSPSLLFHREDGSSPFGYSFHTHITYINISPTPVIDLVRNSFNVMNIVEICFTEPYFTAVSHQLREVQRWELIVLLLVNTFPAFYGTKLLITVFTTAPHCPYTETYISPIPFHLIATRSARISFCSLYLILPRCHFFQVYQPNFVAFLFSYTCHTTSPSSLSVITLVIFAILTTPFFSTLLLLSHSSV